MNTIHTSSSFMCFWIKFGLCSIYFLGGFLLKVPMIYVELLPYIQLICQMRCQKIWYLYIQYALSESSMIWICHRRCHKIGKFDSEGNHPSMDFAHITFFVSIETTNGWYRIAPILELELFSHHFFFIDASNICSFCLFLMVVFLLGLRFIDLALFFVDLVRSVSLVAPLIWLSCFGCLGFLNRDHVLSQRFCQIS